MSFQSFMVFRNQDGSYLKSESQFQLKDVTGATVPTTVNAIEIEDWSFDVEQTLSIGSTATGAGAGKITFNPFLITRRPNTSSPRLFVAAASGTPFKAAHLLVRKVGSAGAHTFMQVTFKLIAVKTMAWANDENGPKETVTFEYGALQVRMDVQSANGAVGVKPVPGGWNRVTNAEDESAPEPWTS